MQIGSPPETFTRASAHFGLIAMAELSKKTSEVNADILNNCVHGLSLACGKYGTPDYTKTELARNVIEVEAIRAIKAQTKFGGIKKLCSPSYRRMLARGVELHSLLIANRASYGRYWVIVTHQQGSEVYMKALHSVLAPLMPIALASDLVPVPDLRYDAE